MAETPHGFERGPNMGWGWILAAGIVLILGGFVAAVHPFATSLATALLLSIALTLGGVLALGAGVSNLRDPRGWLYLLLGLLGTAVGVVVFLNPFASVVSLVWVIGAWLIAGGLIELIGAVRTRRGRGWLILLGLIDIALGILLVLMDPFSALFFLSVAIGFSFVLRGIASVLFALALRRLAAVPPGGGEAFAA